MEDVLSEISVPVTVSDDIPEEVKGSAKTSDDDQRLTIKEKLRLFLCTHWRGILCFAVPLILIPIQLSFPPEKYQWCAYTLVLMAVFWVAECIPLAVTSFLPIVTFPLTGIMSTTETCACYMNCAYTLVLMAVFWVAECIPLAVTSFLPIVTFPLTGIMSTTETCACYMNCAYTLVLMAVFWVAECIPLAVTSFLPIVTFPLTGIMSSTTETCACYMNCAYTLVLMAVFWVAECIPLAVTSFLSIVTFPLTGIMSTTETCACYMNDTIIMFLGSMWLAYAVEQSGLHMRLALCAIRSVGYSHYKLLFAMSFITMFISMWITNTAATTMMVPINFALLKVFEDQNLIKIYDTGVHGENVASDITTCYFCAASFSATVGGIGTLVGTATNFVFKGLFSKVYPDAPEYLSFPKFSAFAIPYMLLMEICIYLYLVVVYFGFLRPNSIAAKNAQMPSEGIEAAKKAVDERFKALGRITFWETLVIVLFSFAILLFFSRSPQIFTGWGDIIPEYYNIKDKKFIKDSAAVIMVVFLMLLLPFSMSFFDNCIAKNHGELPEKSIQSVLDWRKMNNDMPYGFMFLLGGGFALSEAAKKEYTDLNGKIGTILKHFQNMPNSFLIFVVVVFTIFTTNFASNVAVCNVIVPIVMQLAKEINKNPLWYNIAAGFSSSFSFCLPVGTPGNLVVQSAANIPTSKMIKAGFGPTVTTTIITWFCICFWAPVVWPDLKSSPNWI